MTDEEMIAGFLRYQESRSFSQNTITRRRKSLCRFARFMAPQSIAQAKPVDVEDWMIKLRSPRTRHAYRGDLNVFYRWAIRRELLTDNPVDGTDSIKVPRGVPKPASQEWIAAAFASAGADLQLAIALGSLAGLRISEIASLDMANVHLAGAPPVIVVRDGKGAKDRIVPMHPTLQTLLANRPPGWLFPSQLRSGRHVLAASMSARLRDHLGRFGLAHFTMHQLRHAFATQAAQLSHGNLLLVATLLGHTSIETTRGYCAWAPEEGAKVIARMTGVEHRDDLAQRRAERAG